MLKNVADITSQGKQTGLNTQDNILDLDKSQTPNMMNVIVNFDGSLEKRMGSNTQNTLLITNSAGSGFAPAGTLVTSLQSYWKLDEASGDRSDSIGNNVLLDNNGVLSDGGIRNKAALFVIANTQYLLVNNNSTLTTGNIDFSLAGWFYLNSTSTTIERTVVSKRDGTTGSSNPDFSLTDNSQQEIGSNIAFSLKGAGQTFIATGNYTMSGFILKLLKVGSPTGDVVASLYAVAGGIPNGAALASSSTVDVSTISGVAAEVTFNFTVPYAVTNGVSYAIVIETQANYVGDGTNHVNMRTDNGGPYSSGQVVAKNSSSIWTTGSDDAYFKTIKQDTTVDYEFWLFVNTDNILTFRVSSSGTMHNGQISASSFGALNTATFYSFVAYHDAGNDLLALGINSVMNSASYALGVRGGSAPFVIGTISNGLSAFFDGRVDEVGFWKKALSTSDRTLIYNAGSGNTFGTAFDNKPWASFDFGASAIRWLTVAAGTGIYASSNLGVTWVNIATDRTATYQYFERSKNVLIATSDLYDTPLAWSGSANTFMVMVNSNAPLCKYSINFQGFLILLNSNTRKRGFFYQDENTQLTGTWISSFDIPSSQDDEITAAFILRRYLYVSTRYYLYRISYVGGNPDFSFLKLKDWGYVQRTVRQLYVDGVGQVVSGLCWDGKMRLFDGSDEQIFSDNIEQDNSLCDFALDNISFSGSGPVISFAETDYNENVYKLCVAIGNDSNQTTHMLNYDGRAKAFYPFDRQHFNTMVMAESGNRRFLMAFDRSGYCHMLNSGNLDGNTTPINDLYDSNIIFEKSPSQIQKGYQTHFFFGNQSCGRLYYLDRIDFDAQYKQRDSFVISGSDKKIHIHKIIDVPESYNAYQWRITSSSGTEDPWKLQRYDHMLHGLGIGKNE